MNNSLAVRPLVQVLEWEMLALPDSLDSAHVRDRIVRSGETAFGDAFRLRRGRVYARNLVGLLDGRRYIVAKI